MKTTFKWTRMAMATGMVLASVFIATSVGLAKSQNLGGLILEEVVPRIMTPNDDGVNDKIFFKFQDSLVGIHGLMETGVFDVNGARVANLNFDSSPNMDSFLTWDGKDKTGRTVPAGIYIYSIKIGRHLATGTVVVAR